MTDNSPNKASAHTPRGGGPLYRPSKAAGYVGESINSQGNQLAFRSGKGGILGAMRRRGQKGARRSTGINPLESITGPYLHRA